MSARFLPVSNTFIEVLLWFSDMAECRDITRSAARPIVSAGRLPKNNYFAFKRATDRKISYQRPAYLVSARKKSAVPIRDLRFCSKSGT
jgi:hypothetical protein